MLDFEKYKNHLSYELNKEERTRILNKENAIKDAPMSATERRIATEELLQEVKGLKDEKTKMRRAEEERLMQLFRDDCEIAYNFDHFSTETKNKIHETVWMLREGNDLRDVYDHYAYFINLIEVALKNEGEAYVNRTAKNN